MIMMMTVLIKVACWRCWPLSEQCHWQCAHLLLMGNARIIQSPSDHHCDEENDDDGADDDADGSGYGDDEDRML